MDPDYDVHARLQDIMDENFGPFPTEPVEWLLNKLEEELFRMRQEATDIAHALGVCYEADGHDCCPGPPRDQLERVAELADLEREHIEDPCADRPEWRRLTTQSQRKGER